jgi:hypothetical protein
VNGFSRKVIDRGDRRRRGAGSEDFDVDDLVVRCDEVDDLPALIRDGQIADRDIGKAVVEVGEQLVARRRDDVDRERPLAELLRVFLVDPALEVPDELRAKPTLAPLVDEIQRPAVGRGDESSAARASCRDRPWGLVGHRGVVVSACGRAVADVAGAESLAGAGFCAKASIVINATSRQAPF